uniref:Uncharacterized protein n=1 Tax=viral metagenome TaxID=1070528 RepID=A0A6C0B4I8_9ZZZZ
MMENIFNDLMNKFIEEINKHENISKIQKSLVDPLIRYTFNKIYPYLILVSVIFLLIFILSLSILLLQIKQFRSIDLNYS